MCSMSANHLQTAYARPHLFISQSPDVFFKGTTAWQLHLVILPGKGRPFNGDTVSVDRSGEKAFHMRLLADRQPDISKATWRANRTITVTYINATIAQIIKLNFHGGFTMDDRRVWTFSVISNYSGQVLGTTHVDLTTVKVYDSQEQLAQLLTEGLQNALDDLAPLYRGRTVLIQPDLIYQALGAVDRNVPLRIFYTDDRDIYTSIPRQLYNPEIGLHLNFIASEGQHVYAISSNRVQSEIQDLRVQPEPTTERTTSTVTAASSSTSMDSSSPTTASSPASSTVTPFPHTGQSDPTSSSVVPNVTSATPEESNATMSMEDSTPLQTEETGFPQTNNPTMDQSSQFAATTTTQLVLVFSRQSTTTSIPTDGSSTTRNEVTQTSRQTESRTPVEGIVIANDSTTSDVVNREAEPDRSTEFVGSTPFILIIVAGLLFVGVFPMSFIIAKIWLKKRRIATGRRTQPNRPADEPQVVLSIKVPSRVPQGPKQRAPSPLVKQEQQLPKTCSSGTCKTFEPSLHLYVKPKPNQQISLKRTGSKSSA